MQVTTEHRRQAAGVHPLFVFWNLRARSEQIPDRNIWQQYENTFYTISVAQPALSPGLLILKDCRAPAGAKEKLMWNDLDDIGCGPAKEPAPGLSEIACADLCRALEAQGMRGEDVRQLASGMAKVIIHDFIAALRKIASITKP